MTRFSVKMGNTNEVLASSKSSKRKRPASNPELIVYDPTELNLGDIPKPELSAGPFEPGVEADALDSITRLP